MVLSVSRDRASGARPRSTSRNARSRRGISNRAPLARSRLTCAPEGEMPIPVDVVRRGEVDALVGAARFFASQGGVDDDAADGEHVLQLPAVRSVELAD